MTLSTLLSAFLPAAVFAAGVGVGWVIARITSRANTSTITISTER